MLEFARINGKLYNSNILINKPLLSLFIKEVGMKQARAIKNGEYIACNIIEYETCNLFDFIKRVASLLSLLIISYGFLVLLIGLAPMPR